MTALLLAGFICLPHDNIDAHDWSARGCSLHRGVSCCGRCQEQASKESSFAEVMRLAQVSA